MSTYAGIGSRQTPLHILTLMTAIAAYLGRHGHTLSSGGADGADSAFEHGVDITPNAKKTIYYARDADGDLAALDLASKHHPNWAACSPYARLLHARNGYIALGKNLDQPVRKIICWTPKALGGGGTGQAIRLAAAWNIPVIDLACPVTEARVRANMLARP